MTLILNGTDNSASVPAVTGTDTDTGVYYPAANQVAIATNGAQSLLVNATQGVQFNAGISVGGTAPSTDGTGIKFPATQISASDANTLDDYEEGTWTPTITFGGATTGQVYAVQVGVYTKIGNTVIAVANCQLSTTGSATGNMGMSGLPFAANSLTNYIAPCAALIDNASSALDQPIGNIAYGATSVDIIAGTGANNATALTNSALAANFRLRVSVVYQVS